MAGCGAMSGDDIAALLKTPRNSRHLMSAPKARQTPSCASNECFDRTETATPLQHEMWTMSKMNRNQPIQIYVSGGSLVAPDNTDIMDPIPMVGAFPLCPGV